MRPHIHTLAKPAANASSRYMTSIAVSSAPLEAGDRKPAVTIQLPLKEGLIHTISALWRATCTRQCYVKHCQRRNASTYGRLMTQRRP